MSSIRDIIVILSITFTVAIAIILIVMMNHKVFTAVSVNPTVSAVPEATDTLTSASNVTDKTDYMFLAGFIGFFISIIVLGYIIGGHPIFSVIYFIALIIITFLSLVLQKIWSYMLSINVDLSSTVTNLPITNYIMAHIAYFIFAMGILGMISLYANYGGQYQQ